MPFLFLLIFKGFETALILAHMDAYFKNLRLSVIINISSAA
jgi:hypothetical protein